MRNVFATLFFVSIGMLEHVGLADYVGFGRLIRSLLTHDGRGLLHFIGPANAVLQRSGVTRFAVARVR